MPANNDHWQSTQHVMKTLHNSLAAKKAVDYLLKHFGALEIGYQPKLKVFTVAAANDDGKKVIAGHERLDEACRILWRKCYHNKQDDNKAKAKT